MTQNLNLDLTAFTDPNADVTLNSSNTDLNSKTTWTPDATTLTSTLADATTARYRYNTDYQQSYYNWYAATAESVDSGTTNVTADDTICPYGWTIPTSNNSNSLLTSYGITNFSHAAYDDERFTLLSSFPLFWNYKGSFYRSGEERVIDNSIERSVYWLKTTQADATRANFTTAYRGGASSSNGELSYYSSSFREFALEMRCVQR